MNTTESVILTVRLIDFEQSGKNCSFKLTYGEVNETVDSNTKTFIIESGTRVFFEIITGNNAWGDEIGAKYIDITEGNGKQETIGNLKTFDYIVSEDTVVEVTFGNPSSNTLEIVNMGGGTLYTFLGNNLNEEDSAIVQSTHNYRFITLTYDVNEDGAIPFIRFFYDDDTKSHYTSEIELDVESKSISYKCTGGQYRIEVEFVIPPESVTLSAEELVLEKGETKTLNAIVSPGGSEYELTWYAPNNRVAEVDRYGTVKAVDVGTVFVEAEVYIPYTNIILSDCCKVTVLQEHAIIVNTTEGGTAVASGSTAVMGAKIDIILTPSENHHLTEVTITDSNGNGIEYEYTNNGISFIMPDADVEVDVCFDINVHTIRFLNGDEIHSRDIVEHGSVIKLPEEIPKRESSPQTDYDFIGWKDYTEGMVADRDYDFQAMYSETPRMYEIVFLSVDIVVESKHLPYGAIIEPPNAPERNGYVFIGWDGYIDGMTVDGSKMFFAIYEESDPHVPPYFDEGDYIPIPPVIYSDDEEDNLWIIIVMGCVATLIFFVFFHYERRG